VASTPAFGVALENFTPDTKSPDFEEILSFSQRAENLGFASLWVWDHILLGSKRPFPFLDSLTVLAALTGVTKTVDLGTGILVLPLRNPVVLSKVTSTIDRISSGRLVLGVASGWYEKEFEACGVDFKTRGRTFRRNLDVLNRLWTEDEVTGETDGMVFKRAVMLPKPEQRPRPRVLMGGYVDKVLRRVARLSDGWLTYFYTPQSFASAWSRIRGYAEEAGRDPAELKNVAQLPICIDRSFERADAKVHDFIQRYFDVAPWSESTPDSAIRGTIEQCAEQLQGHLDAGVEHVVFVVQDYEEEQLEQIATELLPAIGFGESLGAGARA
jgi:probable F420-dependent oxidoreductase